MPAKTDFGIFIDDQRTKTNHDLATKMLDHFDMYYNYGVRYSIRVGQEDSRHFYGTSSNSSYQVEHNGFKVLVIQTAQIDDDYFINKTFNKLMENVKIFN